MKKPRTITAGGFFSLTIETSPDGQLTMVLTSRKVRVRARISDYLIATLGRQLHTHIRCRESAIAAAKRALAGQ